MKQTFFDAHNQQQITVELTCHGYKPVIMGSGYFIIPNPGSKYVSFSKAAHDSCIGDITAEVIPDYTNQQYADEYGDRVTGMNLTVREYMRRLCRTK